jgi:alpha-D-ribose 1-methylphosphonate 5-triphosphate synthase subunit PhnH
VAIAEALIDLETSYYTPDRALLFQLSASGARALGQETALYQFYPGLQDADLAGLAAAPRGTPLAPDQSATLVIGCRFGVGTRQQWSGPGIRTRLEVVLAGLPDAFWPARQAAGPYPLGWDVFFVDSDHVLGLPRTTQVEVSRWHM